MLTPLPPWLQLSQRVLFLLSQALDTCHLPVPAKAAFVPFVDQDLPSCGSVSVSIHDSEDSGGVFSIVATMVSFVGFCMIYWSCSGKKIF